MKIRLLLAAAALSALSGAPVLAQSGDGWRRQMEAGGLSIDIPTRLFSVDAGMPDRGQGRKLTSADGRARLSYFSLPNDRLETPRSYVRDRLTIDPSSLIYRRITDRFFVVSSVRDGNIFYSRCNFGRVLRCIYMEYPQTEKRAFDPIVTRISHSLS
jgi:hypothetical protein